MPGSSDRSMSGRPMQPPEGRPVGSPGRRALGWIGGGRRRSSGRSSAWKGDRRRRRRLSPLSGLGSRAGGDRRPRAEALGYDRSPLRGWTIAIERSRADRGGESKPHRPIDSVNPRGSRRRRSVPLEERRRTPRVGIVGIRSSSFVPMSLETFGRFGIAPATAPYPACQAKARSIAGTSRWTHFGRAGFDRPSERRRRTRLVHRTSRCVRSGIPARRRARDRIGRLGERTAVDVLEQS